MRGRNHFSADEATWIRQQLRRLRVAERDEQKRIRAGLRRAGFRISDWSTDSQGFTASDFDDLVRRGVITVGVTPYGPGTTTGSGEPTSPGPERAPGRAGDEPDGLAASAGEADTIDALVAAALAALTTGTRRTVDEAEAEFPNGPGLYALYADAAIWEELGLGAPPDDRPLYVGKAEDSLVTRDLRTHSRTGRTGQSTVRRSFAALLADNLDLEAQPRNPAKPEKFTHYGLAADGDERLTVWMRRHLRIAVWPHDRGSLGAVETRVIRELKPPLNLTGMTVEWTAPLKAARAQLAAQAKQWALDRGLDS